MFGTLAATFPVWMRFGPNSAARRSGVKQTAAARESLAELDSSTESDQIESSPDVDVEKPEDEHSA